MKRGVGLALSLLAVACRGGSGQTSVTFDGRQALLWVQHQVAAGPRVPGTEAHRVIGAWIEAQLRRRADTVEVQAWTHVTQRGDSLPMRNFLARFRPADPNRVLYVAHWDSRPNADEDPDPARRRQPVPGANDGASGVALLLGVADALRLSAPSVGVDLLLTDGEDWGDDFSGPDALIGARYFARTLPPGYRPLFAVVWDMVGDRNQRFEQEGHSLDRSPEVVERVWTTAESLGLRRVFRPQRGGYITDDHIPLLEAGLRAIDVIDWEYDAWHTTADTPDKVSAQSLENVGRVALALVR
jgi:hypothetical protein